MCALNQRHEKYKNSRKINIRITNKITNVFPAFYSRAYKYVTLLLRESR